MNNLHKVGSFLTLLVLIYQIKPLKADCAKPSETTASGTFFEPREKLCPGDLIFEEKFDTFNLKKWEHERTLSGGGNWEFQYYSNNRSNSFVENGHLHIKPTLMSADVGENYLYSGTFDCNGGQPADHCTDPSFYGCSRTGTASNIINPIKSARIRTAESFSFKYGTVVVKAKLPAGDWLWPAIWLLPRDNAYGTWPASGEIDLLESRGNKNLFDLNGVNVGTHQVSHTLHWGPNSGYNRYSLTQWKQNNAAGYDSDFHIYKLEWNPNRITFYIDNKTVGSLTPGDAGFWSFGGFEKSRLDNPWKGGSKMAPFDQEFYLVINLAVGGINFFADSDTNPGGKPWSNTSPTASTDFWNGKNQWMPTWNLEGNSTHLIVDYVQVFAI